MGNRAGKIQGFTLVEMALVLVVIGIVIGIGAGMIGPLTNLSKTRETKELLGATVESVNSWAASNNRLPDIGGGITDFRNTAKTPLDAWGRNLIYLYDSAFATAPFSKDTICGRKTTQITVQTIDPAATISNVAFVVISQGGDPQIAAPSIFTTFDTAVTGPAVTASTTLAAPRTIFVNAGTDDIIRWVTLDELRSKVGCQGAQLRIVNNELPPATVASAYPNITLSIDGGATAASTYRWCIESIAATPLPTGLTFTTTTPALPIRVTPANSCASLPEASWGVVTASPYLLTISGTPAANMQGAYSFTLYVRDNNDTTGSNDNITSKAFVLTVNP